ncbi:glycoside hydrolase family 16 protein [Jaapia argillacea MUCL 33604]|uniref:Glycoside hydrolase family 16 protein n=1 Tax=Jaapia argillacea MUCL 33604 TaxID=933084 RepID=A0A067Q666_9AGAM|nr:glycoside hydrolase family 16 protein [Jaapia argillacea MUCL 33604]
MSGRPKNTSRRVPPPSPTQYSTQYYAVPQNAPQSPPRGYTPSQSTYVSSRAPPPRAPSTQAYSTQVYSTQAYSTQSHGSRRADVAQDVASGSLGGGYGPYSYNPSQTTYNGASSYSVNVNGTRFSAPASEASETTGEKTVPVSATTSSVPPYMWDTKDPDLDDALHNPDPVRDAALDRSFTIFSGRGWANASAIIVLVGGLVTLFAGYPIIAFYTRKRPPIVGYNLGGINGSGQIPDLPGLPTLIDVDTPQSAYTRTGTDGDTYNLVFSDEFNVDGRTFWPGDDPFWEAANLNYWPTGDLEWYDPQAITTQGGKLVITMSEQNTHNLNFQSGMLTSWNKFCFTTGYIEVSVSMPGSPQAPGLWPGVWTMGNLGRAGYGATTEGMWPYSYASCDLGTFPNQTNKDGTPTAAATGAPDGGPLSYLPGQRLSACTCPGSDHPGPSVNIGRGVPEIDILETQVDTAVFQGQVSQSFQTAPYNYQYNFDNSTPATTIFDSSQTTFNSYKGGVFQQALSAVTFIDSNNYNGVGYAPYGLEWWSDPKHRDQGYITWFSNNQKTWGITSGSLGPDTTVQIQQRLIPEEPMYIIMNLGMSPSFQGQDFKHLVFPSKMYIDYVRVYQRSGTTNIGCSPKSYPTSDYINKHINAYTNPNLTTWAQAGYTFPRNSLYDGC